MQTNCNPKVATCLYEVPQNANSTQAIAEPGFPYVLAVVLAIGAFAVGWALRNARF